MCSCVCVRHAMSNQELKNKGQALPCLDYAEDFLCDGNLKQMFKRIRDKWISMCERCGKADKLRETDILVNDRPFQNTQRPNLHGKSKNVASTATIREIAQQTKTNQTKMKDT